MMLATGSNGSSASLRPVRDGYDSPNSESRRLRDQKGPLRWTLSVFMRRMLTQKQTQEIASHRNPRTRQSFEGKEAYRSPTFQESPYIRYQERQFSLPVTVPFNI